MKEASGLIALLAAVASAALGLYAALGVHVRDNMDAFISNIRRQSFWASWAAAAAGVSVLAQVIERVLK